MNGFITNIKRNTLDDGPGIRTIIFFKGCPLRCVWCQNPETQSVKQEISYQRENCLRCKKCEEKCPEGAIDVLKKYTINKNLCTYCGLCIDVCKSDSLKFVGTKYSTSQLIDKIIKDKIFYENSGGGITLSGGEPTMQMKFLNKFLEQLKPQNIHVCLETCGYFDSDLFFKYLNSYIDLIYFDLKIFDNKLHKKYCGVSNILILKNFEQLINSNSIEILPRIPLIPKITTSNKNLISWAEYLKELNIQEIALLPYNPLWISKTATLGIKPEYEHVDWLSIKEKERIKKIFLDFKFRNF
jgi:pyruvate formate lyase activating enzyme